MPQVAQVTQPHPIHGKAEYGVGTPLPPLGLIMVGGDALKRDAFDLLDPCALDYLGAFPHRGGIVVISVVVTHRHDVGGLVYAGLA